MAAFPLDDMDLIDDLHLSPSQGERLVAILALGKRPAPKFFRWLTERAVVSPYGTGARVVFGFVLGCGVSSTYRGARLARREHMPIRLSGS